MSSGDSLASFAGTGTCGGTWSGEDAGFVQISRHEGTMEHPPSTHLPTFLRRVYQTQTAGLAEPGAVMRQQVRQSPPPIWLERQTQSSLQISVGKLPRLLYGTEAPGRGSERVESVPGAGTVSITSRVCQ